MNYLTQSSRTNSSMNYSLFIFKPNIHCILLDLNQPKLGLVLMVIIITCLDLLISQAINYEYKYIYTCKLKHLLALKCFLAKKKKIIIIKTFGTWMNHHKLTLTWSWTYLQLKLWSVKLQEVQETKEIVGIDISIQENPARPALHGLQTN